MLADVGPLIIGEFVARDSSPSFRGLNHGSAVNRDMPCHGALMPGRRERGTFSVAFYGDQRFREM
jgi:hypothetical protein